MAKNLKHEDLTRDALATAVDMAIKPTRNLGRTNKSNIVWSQSKFRAGSR